MNNDYAFSMTVIANEENRTLVDFSLALLARGFSIQTLSAVFVDEKDQPGSSLHTDLRSVDDDRSSIGNTPFYLGNNTLCFPKHDHYFSEALTTFFADKGCLVVTEKAL